MGNNLLHKNLLFQYIPAARDDLKWKVLQQPLNVPVRTHNPKEN